MDIGMAAADSSAVSEVRITLEAIIPAEAGDTNRTDSFSIHWPLVSTWTSRMSAANAPLAAQAINAIPRGTVRGWGFNR
jgi:hypothetical protein